SILKKASGQEPCCRRWPLKGAGPWSSSSGTVPATRQESAGTAGKRRTRRYLSMRPMSSANRNRNDLPCCAYRGDRPGHLPFFTLPLIFRFHRQAVASSFLELDTALFLSHCCPSRYLPGAAHHLP